jgi:hypothetical protein
MEDALYWYLKCKVCSHFHLGPKVENTPLGTYVPSDRVEPCPNNPEKSAAYHQSDWRQMTVAQWKEEEGKLGKPR